MQMQKTWTHGGTCKAEQEETQNNVSAGLDSTKKIKEESSSHVGTRSIWLKSTKRGTNAFNFR